MSDPLARLRVELGFDLAFCPVPADYAGKSRAVRACALALLAARGVAASEIGHAPSGAPLWPPGWTGSLSHAGTLGAAVVAPTTRLRSVGVDLELAHRVHRGLWPHILAPQEIAALETLARVDAEHRAAATFSAKEAIYKTLSPLGVAVPGFQEVALCWENEDHFTASPESAALCPPLRDLQGLVTSHDGHLLALCWSRWTIAC